MSKFTVNDWVTIIGTDPLYFKAHVLEVIAQKCEAGIVQNSYKCRVFQNEPKMGWVHCTKETFLREMELGIKTEKPN